MDLSEYYYSLRRRSRPARVRRGKPSPKEDFMRMKKVVAAALLAIAPLLASQVSAEERVITVASTTSTEQSGLFGYILPVFEKESGIKVRVVALGTGQALDTARRGDADVAFVHDKAAEEKFVAEGSGVERREVMYNDFVLVGPKSDPAQAAGKDILEGLRRIAGIDAASRPPFVSRGDKSGTHAAELRYWKAAGIDLEAIKGPWYRDTGSGMGPSLNMASSANGYILADRGTWLSFRNRGELVILVEGDNRLFNQYGVILVNPAKHPHVKKVEGQRFIDWLVSPAGQKAIADYKIGGEQLFFPNAR
jgi:tungstate transport system substrate-binding protein